MPVFKPSRGLAKRAPKIPLHPAPMAEADIPAIAPAEATLCRSFALDTSCFSEQDAGQLASHVAEACRITGRPHVPVLSTLGETCDMQLWIVLPYGLHSVANADRVAVAQELVEAPEADSDEEGDEG